jgi:septum site-determining protein MinC
MNAAINSVRIVMQSNGTSEGSPAEVLSAEASSPEVGSSEVGLAEAEVDAMAALEDTASVEPDAVSMVAPSAKQGSADLPAVGLSPAERATQSGHIFFKADQGLLYLHLPSSRSMPVEWSAIWEQLQQRLESSQRIWPPNTPVHLVANDRLLDQRQLDQLANALANVQLSLQRVLTSRRQTAIAAVTSGYSVDQQSPTLTLAAAPAARFVSAAAFVLAEPLYLETTLRSGTEVRHPGSIVLVGDANPGSAMIADGDILVWGRLRGVAHAGAHGDRDRQIMALQLEPTQIRIADQVARAPAQDPNQASPEVAYVAAEGIQIMRSSEYYRRKSNSRSDV